MNIKKEFSIIGKPIHPNKRVAIFELCNKFIQTKEQVEDEDWKILNEECNVINFENKHTRELFTCKIKYIHW